MERLHYFFKVFFKEQSLNHLKIPSAFREHIEAAPLGKFYLKGLNGSIWIVNLVKKSDGLYFEKGWKEFVLDQSLVTGDFLVFQYDGDSKFTVLVFDSTACEKKKSIVARPSVKQEDVVLEESEKEEEEVVVVKESEKEEDIALDLSDDAWVESNLKQRKRRRSKSEAQYSKKSAKKASGALAVPKNPKSDADTKKANLNPESEALITPSRTKSSPNGNKVGPIPDSKAFTTVKRSKLNPSHKKAHCTPKSNDLATPKEEVETDSPSTSDKSSRRTRQTNGKTVHRNSNSSAQNISINKKSKSEYQNRQGSRCSPSPSKTNTSKEQTSSWQLVKSGHLVRRYKKADGRVTGILRMGSLVSQRRPVTNEEINRTLQLAMSFKSEHPFTIAVMQESYVYTSFFMSISAPFAREHLPKVNTVMTVWDPNDKPWKITYIAYVRHGALSGGWGKFTYAHNLEKYDVCIFELIKSTHLRVHIYRVVDEIMPLLRNGCK